MIAQASPKQTNVLALTFSFIMIYVSVENAIIPVAKPINLPGQSSPL